jgi:hypothetical protein
MVETKPDPVLAGEITTEGVIGLLAEIERRRTTGALRFEAGDVVGEVALVSGQLALEQGELPDGRDPVEVLLQLREGHYDLFQRLPALPVSRGDERRREGSLAVHVPADLMNFCERAGLTGKLTLLRDNRRAETVYDKGELVAIRVDGTDDADLHEVFGWEEGAFQITAFSVTPSVDVDVPDEEEDPADREPTIRMERRRRDETGKQFLKVVEVALTSILEEREKRRSPTRTSPPLPPAPKTQRPDSMSDADQPATSDAPRREPTVKVIYLGDPEPVEPDPSVPPPRRRPIGKAKADPGARSTPSRDDGALAVAGWVAVVVVLMIALLAALARLPL